MQPPSVRNANDTGLSVSNQLQILKQNSALKMWTELCRYTGTRKIIYTYNVNRIHVAQPTHSGEISRLNVFLVLKKLNQFDNNTMRYIIGAEIIDV